MARPTFARWVLAARVLLFAVAAGAATLALALNRSSDEPPRSAEKPPQYVCPMHPEVVSSTPSDCPICRMKLELVKAKPKSSAKSGSQGAASFSIPASSEFRAFDAVSRTKPFALSLEMRAPAWIDAEGAGVALLFRDEAELIEAGEPASFMPAGLPKDGAPPGIKVVASGEAPEPWDARSVHVRFHGDGAPLPVGATGTVKFATRIRRGLVVRASSIVQSPEGPFVFVVSEDRRTMTKRPVQIGNIIYDYAAVVSGLQEDEYVAARHLFSLESERRLHGEVSL